MLKYEREAAAGGRTLVAGVDEVGRGPLAGPVVAAAVILDSVFLNPETLKSGKSPHLWLTLIKDSKKLTPKKRQALLPLIYKGARGVGVGIVWPGQIDELNILRASLLAMERAVLALFKGKKSLEEKSPVTLLSGKKSPVILLPGKNLPGKKSQKEKSHVILLPGKKSSVTLSPDFLLIDGVHRIDSLNTIDQLAIVSGDSKSASIACASIVAKVARDNIMCAYHTYYPQYNFPANKGYGTREHVTALRNCGPTPIHRKSFKVKALQGEA